MKVGTRLVHAARIFKEEAAVFCATERSVHKSAVVDVLVETEQTERGLLLLAVSDVRTVAKLCFLVGFPQLKGQDTTVLAEVLVLAQHLFSGNLWRDSNHIQGSSLQNPLLGKLLNLFAVGCWCSVQRQRARNRWLMVWRSKFSYGVSLRTIYHL